VEIEDLEVRFNDEIYRFYLTRKTRKKSCTYTGNPDAPDKHRILLDVPDNTGQYRTIPDNTGQYRLNTGNAPDTRPPGIARKGMEICQDSSAKEGKYEKRHAYAESLMNWIKQG
jgi:hypothetical protein